MLKRILPLGALALVLGGVARLLSTPAPAVAVSAGSPEEAESQGDGRPRWEQVWSKPAPALASMDISPDGKTVTWVDSRGCIRCMDTAGHTLWQTQPIGGLNHVVATPSGTVLAYSWLNPTQPSVRIFGARNGGKAPITVSVAGAVWNVSVSGDGSKAVVGTGQRDVYVLPLPMTPATAVQPAAHWRAPGIAESMAVSSGEPFALFGTWQDAGVSAFALDGTVRWRHDEREPARRYRVDLSADGRTAVGVSAIGPHESEARLHLWAADTGHLLWAEDLEGFHPKALATRGGQFIAVTYAKTLSYSSGDATERKLALFDRQGRRLWEKGGLFFSPVLVAVSASGARLTVTDGASTLYTLDGRGHIVSRMRLPSERNSSGPPTIREIRATPDGSFLLVRRGDGQLSLLKAT